MIKKHWIRYILFESMDNLTKKRGDKMYRIERLLDTVLGYTGWHDLTNTLTHREQELQYLYDDEDDDDNVIM